MRTVRDWWRWFSNETGRPWMAAILLVLMICGPIVVTAWAVKDAMTGVHRVEREGGHIQQKP